MYGSIGLEENSGAREHKKEQKKSFSCCVELCRNRSDGAEGGGESGSSRGLLFLAIERFRLSDIVRTWRDGTMRVGKARNGEGLGESGERKVGLLLQEDNSRHLLHKHCSCSLRSSLSLRLSLPLLQSRLLSW